jgi:transcriptional regulator with XRE-family HTH domain
MGDGPRQIVKRRRLRAELRSARMAAGLTQDEVAAAMEWSPSKIIRIEAGSVGVSANDMKALLKLYGITEPKRADELLTLARLARERLTTYRDAPPKFLQFIDYEAASATIRGFQPLVVPGLLQTEEYARAVIQAVMPKAPKAQVEAAVTVRMRRQEILTRPGPVELLAVVDEAVVRRQVGGEDAMRRQVKHLVAMADRKNVTVEVVRFSAGVHQGMQGPFVIFEFPDAEDDDVLYLESSRGDLIIRDELDEIAAYEERFDALRRLSPGRKGSLAFLEAVAAGEA